VYSVYSAFNAASAKLLWPLVLFPIAAVVRSAVRVTVYSGCLKYSPYQSKYSKYTYRFFIRSIHSFYTDCMHVALVSLLSEIIMVRGGFLSLSTWFHFDDVISSVCV